MKSAVYKHLKSRSLFDSRQVLVLDDKKQVDKIDEKIDIWTLKISKKLGSGGGKETEDAEGLRELPELFSCSSHVHRQVDFFRSLFKPKQTVQEQKVADCFHPPPSLKNSTLK